MGRQPIKKNNAKRKAKEAGNKFTNIISEYATSLKITGEDRAFLGQVLGYGPLSNIMLASDVELRRKASKILADLLVKLYQDCPNLNFYLVTFTHDRGNTSDRGPTVDLKGILQLVDQALRKLKLNCLYVLEVQGLGNFPREGKGRTIMTHVHGVVWTDANLNCENIIGDLNANSVWVNSLNEKPVDIRPIAKSEGDLAYIAYYMMKPPYDVKMVEQRDNGPRLKSTEKGYRPEFAARILECLCQLEFKSMVRSTFEGQNVRKEWARRLTYWHKSRPKWTPEKRLLLDLSSFWNRFRSKKKRKKYLPFRIIR